MNPNITAAGIALGVLGLLGYYLIGTFASSCTSHLDTSDSITNLLVQTCQAISLVKLGVISSGIIGLALMVFGIVHREKMRVKKRANSFELDTFLSP